MTAPDKLSILNEVLARCRNAPFYRHRVPRRALSSMEELRQIPVTTKEELRQASPYGLICVPRQELYQYHESFGTTGAPVSTWLTGEDLRASARLINRCGIEFSKYDTVLVRFPYAISSAAHLVHAAARLKRACVIPVSSRSAISPFPRVVDMLKRLEVTILACLPLQALLLAETAEMLGWRPDRDFPRLRAIFTAGEPLTPGRRNLLEEIWGVPVFNHYGMAEIGAAMSDCEFGRFHPPEDYFVIELLTEDLKNEARPGEPGHLVVTTLKKKAAPVIRFLTGDRAVKIQRDCPCGQEYHLEIRGRVENGIPMDGRVIDLWHLDEVVSHLPCRRYWVAGPDAGKIRIVVEEEKAGQGVKPHTSRYLQNKYSLNMQVEVVSQGTLYNRDKLLDVGVVGKARYIYSAAGIQQILSSSRPGFE